MLVLAAPGFQYLAVISMAAACCTYMQDGGVMLVATTRDNVSPSLVLELLRRVGGIIKV